MDRQQRLMALIEKYKAEGKDATYFEGRLKAAQRSEKKTESVTLENHVKVPHRSERKSESATFEHHLKAPQHSEKKSERVQKERKAQTKDNTCTRPVQIQPPDQLPGCDDCENTINFCCTLVVPPNFTFSCGNATGLDTSCLQCVLEPCTVDAIVPNPCNPQGPTLSCPIEINAVIAVGCITFYASAHFINTQNGSEADFCCKGTVCVDNVICHVCADDPNPCEEGFFDQTSASFSTATPVLDRKGNPITTCSGDTIWELEGTITLPSC